MGERIGPLCVERRIGAGGMGEVYLARDDRLERLVAIKLLPKGSGADPAAHARMLREARSLSALKHPGIVTIYDIGFHNGLTYLVMEYVEGETFDDMIQRRGRLPLEEAIALIAQVGDAVAAAHDAGVLHRDLKSLNLMIETGGRAKVLDFGLSKRTDTRSSAPRIPGSSRSSSEDIANAKEKISSREPIANAATLPSVPDREPIANAATLPSSPDHDVSLDATTPAPFDDDAPRDLSYDATTPAPSSSSKDPQTVHGAGMGTPGWAPPELFEGKAADARSDVFSLGCVFYHLITGTPPFESAQWATQRELIAAGPRPPSRTAGVPPTLDSVIAAALDPDPDRRPNDVPALINALRTAVSPKRGKRAALAVGLAGLVAVGAGAVVLLRNTSSGEKPTPIPTPAVAPPEMPKPVRLTNTGGCAYSPTFVDEDTIVFDVTKDGAVDLYRLDLTPGAVPVQLTSDAGWEWRASKGASSSEVVFMVQAKDVLAIDTIDINTKARHRIAEQTGPAAFASGAYYYAPANAGWIKRSRDQAVSPFLPVPPDRPVDTIVASPDGKRLAVMLFDQRRLPQLCIIELAKPLLACIDVAANSARPAFSSTSDALYVDSLGAQGIAKVPIGGGQLVPVVVNVYALGGIAVSPKGSTLLYSDCSSRSELVSVLADPRPLTNDVYAAAPTFGPGGMLAFVRAGRLEPAIVVRTSDGKLREHYQRSGATFSALAIAPDGSEIAFVVAEPSAPGIYVTQVATPKTAKRLTQDAKDVDPIFVGDHILFTRVAADGTPKVMRVRRAGGKPERISTRPRRTVAATGDRALLASRDNKSLYWWNAKTGRELAALPPPHKKVPNDIAISPNGRWILYVTGVNGQELWRGPADGSDAPALVHELPGDRNAQTGAIDDDGKPLVVVSSWSGELWIVPPRAGRVW